MLSSLFLSQLWPITRFPLSQKAALKLHSLNFKRAVGRRQPKLFYVLFSSEYFYSSLKSFVIFLSLFNISQSAHAGEMSSKMSVL